MKRNLTLSTKLLLDRLLGRTFCYICVPATRLLRSIFRRDHSILNSNVRCILIAKYFGLGSIIHATPMINALRKRYPNARFTFLTRRANAPLFCHIENIDTLLTVDDSSLPKLVWSTLRILMILVGERNRPDLFFDLELFSAYGAIVSLLSLARNRIGFFCSNDTDFKTSLYTHLVYFNFYMPIRLCYLQLARIADIARDASTDLPQLRVDDTTTAATHDKLESIVGRRNPKGLIAVNVNASGLSLERRWPLDRFVAVAQHFAKEGYCLVFVGSPDEYGYVQKAVDALQGDVFNITASFSFAELLVVLRTCNTLLTNDSGIMNMGYALGMNTLALYGPCYPDQYHIHRSNTRAIYTQLYCSPCLHHFFIAPCKGMAYCMKNIEANEVIHALEALLAKHITLPVTSPDHKEHRVKFIADNTPLGILRKR